jgi:hypothetical protein
MAWFTTSMTMLDNHVCQRTAEASSGVSLGPLKFLDVGVLGCRVSSIVDLSLCAPSSSGYHFINLDFAFLLLLLFFFVVFVGFFFGRFSWSGVGGVVFGLCDSLMLEMRLAW